MKNVRKAIRVSATLASMDVSLYGALLVVRHLDRWEPAGWLKLLIALAGAAGVLIGVTSFRTMDRTLYLCSKGENQAKP